MHYRLVDSDQNRLKAAMIVFSLEKALGEFVKREHSGGPASS